MKRRIVPVVVAVLLAATGCTHPAGVASPGPARSVELTQPAATPSPTPTPTPVPTIAPTPTRTCAGTPVTLNRTQSNAVGPHGSRRTTGTAAVALTFDDGPDPVNTPRILDVLHECGVRATFCVNGDKVELYPDVVRRIVAEGHTLCNHSYRHIMQLGTYGEHLIYEDLQRTNDAIHRIVPEAPISFFRAPGGNWSDDFITVARELGMVPIDWEVDPSDWDFASWGTGQTMTNHIIGNIEATVRPGSIILSHDYQKPATTAAYRILLPWLQSRFTLTNLPALSDEPPPPPRP